ncbi:MAG: hypothetical protein P1P88_11700 [Bacteroidales bacterium]|nr:hypothetical protein [Bacteroidales bacterium]
MKSTTLILAFFIVLGINSCKKSDNQIVTDAGDISSAEEIQVFPPSHPLNKDITNDPVDPNSTAILNNIGFERGLFADFGSGTWEGAPIGIPYVVVGADQALITINYGEYGDESDPGPFPIPLNAPIEGNGEGDAHVLCVDVAYVMLYELYDSEVNNGAWTATSGAKFDLNAIEYRPDGWTSADAAGLPIFPCLVRYPEVEKGEIDHAIRFTLARGLIYEGYIRPANHLVSGTTNSNQLPFGGRLRLRTDFDISGFSATNQVILTALKKYGLILADVGSSMFISGAPHDAWDNDDLKELDDVKVADFEVIEMGAILTK